SWLRDRNASGTDVLCAQQPRILFRAGRIDREPTAQLEPAPDGDPGHDAQPPMHMGRVQLTPGRGFHDEIVGRIVQREPDSPQAAVEQRGKVVERLRAEIGERGLVRPGKQAQLARVLCGKRYKADETRILLDNALALPKLQSQLVTGGATALPRVIVAAPRADRSYPLRLQPERNELRVRMRQDRKSGV